MPGNLVILLTAGHCYRHNVIVEFCYSKSLAVAQAPETAFGTWPLAPSGKNLVFNAFGSRNRISQK
jgi:hypothetical protein